MKIGFSGSREGMTNAQIVMVCATLKEYFLNVEVHHGCCVGADEAFHALAKMHQFRTVGHPAYPVGHPMRADVLCDEIRPILEPLARNKIIVNECELVIAAPKEMDMVVRSGTWSTVRYARQSGKELKVFLPNGKRW